MDADTSELLGTRLPWAMPTARLFGIWFLLMRRMAGQQPGFRSLGENKAKIHMQADLQVDFDDGDGVDEAEQECMEIVSPHQDILEQGAALLLQKEKIEAVEIEALMLASQDGMKGGLATDGNVE